MVDFLRKLFKGRLRQKSGFFRKRTPNCGFSRYSFKEKNPCISKRGSLRKFVKDFQTWIFKKNIAKTSEPT